MTATSNLHDVLKNHWGFDEFLPLQQDAISTSLAGRDSLVVLPTGGGKSVCYQIPPVVREQTAVVISPLKSLMKDQVDAANLRGVSAATLNSSISTVAQQKAIAAYSTGTLRLLYLSPERLQVPSTLDLLKQHPPFLIAIDEAHCISSWGHDFRPEYRTLSELRKLFPAVPIAAFTATATQQVRQDIIHQLNLSSPEILIGDFHRPNLHYHVRQREKGINQICDVLDRHRNEVGVIYAISRERVEKLSQELNEHNYKTLPYHAGLPEDQKIRHQEAFENDEIEAIVATVAFGMGIDKPNVRYVIHAELPKTIESYQQESGRAGRDGLPAECWLFHAPKDAISWRNIIENSPAEYRAQTLAALEKVIQYCHVGSCRHQYLVEYFGQEFNGPCQSCDLCDGSRPAAHPDSQVIGQKILSCVFRCRQSFGAAHIADVLKGKTTPKVLKFGHEKLSTFGLLSQEPLKLIRCWIEELIGQGFLSRKVEATLGISEAGWELIHGNATPVLSSPGIVKTGTATRESLETWAEVDRVLYEELRQERRRLAIENQIPSYVVFSDATLRDMARIRPTTLENFVRVNGVGQTKAEKWGPIFTKLIADSCRIRNVIADVIEAKPTSPSKTAYLAFPLFAERLSVAEVAIRLGCSHSTVYDYLVTWIKQERITDVTPWVATEVFERVSIAVPFNDTNRLKPLHEAFHGKISYETLKIILAAKNNLQSNG
jgi:ATP-dependent DNA helicase RecQ